MTRRKKTNPNNKGFSLIELLVSITILAVVVVPLLHSFVTASYTNTKAKRVMEATSTAQNLVEEIKADTKTPEELGFEAIADDGSAYTDPTTQTLQCWKKTGTVVVEDGKMQIDTSATLDASKSNTGINGKNFYAEMTLTPARVSTMAQISLMDTETSAIVNVASSVDERMAYSLDPTGSVSDGMTKITKRVIHVTIEQKNGAVQVKPQVTYNDTYEAYPASAGEYVIFKGDELRNVFIFYNGLDTGVSHQEQVVIDNQDNIPVNVYLVRQNTVSMPTTVELKVIENPSGSGTFVTSAVTNLKYMGADPELTVKLYNAAGVEFSASSIDIAGDDGVSGTSWLSKQTNTMIYDIEVNVYEKKNEGGKPLATLTGTKTQ